MTERHCRKLLEPRSSDNDGNTKGRHVFNPYATSFRKGNCDKPATEPGCQAYVYRNGVEIGRAQIGGVDATFPSGSYAYTALAITLPDDQHSIVDPTELTDHGTCRRIGGGTLR